MRTKMVKDGLSTLKKLMQAKYLLNGIRGCILHQIELKRIITWKNMSGKNRINQILLAVIKPIIPIKIKTMLLIKNIKVGNLNKILIIVIISIFVFKISYAQTENNIVGTKTDIKILDKISSKNELVTTACDAFPM